MSPEDEKFYEQTTIEDYEEDQILPAECYMKTDILIDTAKKNNIEVTTIKLSKENQ